ncbi:uroporphyrinogen-III synthase [Bacillus xiapuensis]|uniref:uroporphyrinogen-III synthase n=1 Tax=Bacillus xiapuensis TaxID=2014075 RepID=UPI000C236463|nr:uroporphyrinogen-III synthase [Bacillus xiapuensis]
MGKGLTGKRIALAGSRKTEEMSALVEKQGGRALVRPLQGTVFLAEEQLKPELAELFNQPVDWFIFTTGMGVDTLFQVSGELNKQEAFLTVIRKANIASRGYKTRAALRKLGVEPALTDSDGTMGGLIKELEKTEWSRKKVAVQLHGDPAPQLMEYLTAKGAEVLQLLPYRHIAPDQVVVSALCEEILTGQVDAVCFTTAIQVRALFAFAEQAGYAGALQAAFRETTAAGAVGKVTAEALREEGVARMIVPERERMGALIIELARHFAE